MAVRFGERHLVSPESRSVSGNILDDRWLTPRGRKARAQYAPDAIRAASGGIRHEDAHGFARESIACACACTSAAKEKQRSDRVLQMCETKRLEGCGHGCEMVHGFSRA